MPTDAALIQVDVGGARVAQDPATIVTAALPYATVTMPDGSQILWPNALSLLQSGNVTSDDAYFLSLFAVEAAT
jgi:hypothetical protein